MPKPVLSDSLFNANDVATAILDNAELSVSNQNLGVTDVTSDWSLNTSGGWVAFQPDNCFKFNGFVFASISTYNPSTPSSNDIIYSISSNITPSENYYIPTISAQGDTAEYLVVGTDGKVRIFTPTNTGASVYHVISNFWYRL